VLPQGRGADLEARALRIMGLFPTREQWRGWSLPSKATYAACVVAFVALPFGVIPPLRDLVIWSYDRLFGDPYEASLLNASKKAVRLAIENNTSGNIDVVGARFIVDLYEQDHPVRRSYFAVDVLSDSGARSPLPLNGNSRFPVTVDERSFELIGGGREADCRNYKREKFLWSLVQNQNRGDMFTCALSIDLTASGRDRSIELHTNAVFCDVMFSVLGSLKDYEPPGAKSAEAPRSPSRYCP
jgi:hypothetical protein